MQVSKWGNSLAIRIPADVVRELGLKEGDSVRLRAASDGALEVLTEQERRRQALAIIRRLARPFPSDYKFNREEAHER